MRNRLVASAPRSTAFRNAVGACLFALLAFTPSLVAQKIRTRAGQEINGHVSAVYGDLVFIAAKGGSYQTSVDQLDDASLREVAAFIDRPAVPAPRWRDTNSKLGKGLIKKLRVLRDGKLAEFDPGDRPEPEFYLVYFGAYWCGPCRRFSPLLVRTYQAMKATAPERFEVIFVSDDRDTSGQLAYALEVQMPFPMVRLNASVPEFDRWRGRGIPCLVVLSRHGDLLFHSYSGEEYLGAQDPLEKFSGLHALLSRKDESRSPARHRLAIARQLNLASGGDREAAPYLLSIDPRRNRTLPKGMTLQARVTVDGTGRVKEAEFAPALDFIAEQQLQREAEHWLFVPAVRQGRADSSTITIPVRTPE